MRPALFLPALITALLTGACSSTPLSREARAAPAAAVKTTPAKDQGLKIAIDVVMARLRRAESGDVQSVKMAAPQIYSLAAALMPPAAENPGHSAPPAGDTANGMTDSKSGVPVHPIAYTPKTYAAAPVLPRGRSLFYAVHLGSYRSAGRAFAGFAQLRRQTPELTPLRARVERVDLGPGKGVYERLKAGPLGSRSDAETLCAHVHKAGLYCAVADFTGTGPG